MSETRKLFESFQKNLNEGAAEDNFIKQCEESGKFGEWQMKEIKEGFEEGLSLEQVKLYAKPEFNEYQMGDIKEGFEEGLSMEQVKLYAKPELSSSNMNAIKNGLKRGFSIEQIQSCIKPEFSENQKYEIGVRF